MSRTGRSTAQSTANSKDPLTSNKLRIPAELRLIIYDYLLAELDTATSNDDPLPIPSILHVCRLIGNQVYLISLKRLLSTIRMAQAEFASLADPLWKRQPAQVNGPTAVYYKTSSRVHLCKDDRDMALRRLNELTRLAHRLMAVSQQTPVRVDTNSHGESRRRRILRALCFG